MFYAFNVTHLFAVYLYMVYCFCRIEVKRVFFFFFFLVVSCSVKLWYDFHARPPILNSLLDQLRVFLIWLSYNLYCIKVIYNEHWKRKLIIFYRKKMLKYKLEKQCKRINILKSKTNKYRLIINTTNFIHSRSITMISFYVIGLSMY